MHDTTIHTCIRLPFSDLADCPECRAAFEAAWTPQADPDAPSLDDTEWWAEETRDGNPIDLSAMFEPEHGEAVEMFGHRSDVPYPFY